MTLSSLVRTQQFKATAARLVDEPLRRSTEARIFPSKNRTKSYTPRTNAQSHLQNPQGALSEVSQWLVQPAGQSQLNQSKTKARSFMEVQGLCNFVTKKVQMPDIDSNVSTFDKVLGLVYCKELI